MDNDVAIITVNGKTVRIPEEDLQIILLAAHSDFARSGLRFTESAHAWAKEMLKEMYRITVG